MSIEETLEVIEELQQKEAPIFTVCEASPKAKAKIKSAVDNVGTGLDEGKNSRWPFNALRIGECFTVPLNSGKEISLRISATNRGKKLGKKFCVIVHKDFLCIEVARIA